MQWVPIALRSRRSRQHSVRYESSISRSYWSVIVHCSQSMIDA